MYKPIQCDVRDKNTTNLLVVTNDTAITVEIVKLARQFVQVIRQLVGHQILDGRFDDLGEAQHVKGERKFRRVRDGDHPRRAECRNFNLRKNNQRTKRTTKKKDSKK